MSDERDPKDADRDAILRRRNRFIAIALGGLTGAAAAVGCGESHTPPRDGGADAADAEPVPCLGAVPDDTGPEPCLRMAPPDAGTDALPEPCLSAPFDAGPGEEADAGSATDAGADAEPVPCLSMI